MTVASLDYSIDYQKYKSQILMRLIISIISHDQGKMIVELGTLKLLSKCDKVEVICRDNLNDYCLKEYCLDNGVHYIRNNSPYGFSKNNNLNFEYYINNLSPQEDDWFLLLNPDVKFLDGTLDSILSSVYRFDKRIISANLFLDEKLEVHDDNLRRYPKFRQFVMTYLRNDRSTMIDRSVSNLNYTDVWSSGAFLIIKCTYYLRLEGLDEKYHMYCEDIDFCYRARKIGLSTVLDYDIKAIHFRQRSSRKVFSRYFLWHVTSVFKYCLQPKQITARKSSLKAKR